MLLRPDGSAFHGLLNVADVLVDDAGPVWFFSHAPSVWAVEKPAQEWGNQAGSISAAIVAT
jgi:hypothetical protein